MEAEMKYKLATKSLIVILLLLMVVGCGRGEPTEEANGDAGAEATPAQDAPAEDAPAEDAPAEDAPAEDAPAEDAPAEDAPAEDAPAEDAPAEDAPAEDAPAEATPAQDAPAEDAPAEDAPAEATPAQEAPAGEAPTEQPAPGPVANLTGDWDLSLNVNQWLFSDGRTEDTNATARIGASLTQNGTQISGNFLSVEIDGFNDACTETAIEGTILEDNQVKWTMNYSGACCPGQQITFVGNYDPQANTLTGSFSPLGTPPTDCRPWFADVTGSQR